MKGYPCVNAKSFPSVLLGLIIGSMFILGLWAEVSFVARRDYAIRTFGMGIGIMAVAAGDFNADGLPDIAAAGEYGSNVSILFGRGDGTFEAPLEIAPPVLAANIIRVADFNNDGVDDLTVSAETAIFVILSNGDGSFQRPFRVTTPTIGGRVRITIGDFDGDGRTDVAAVDNGGLRAVRIYLGNGDGTLRPGQEIQMEGELYSVAAGDFDLDGRIDLAVVSGGTLYLFRGSGDGNFAQYDRLGIRPWLRAIERCDLNGDGIDDLAAVIDGEPGWLAVLLGNGDGSFRTSVFYGAGAMPYFMAFADFDGDGDQDIAVCNAGILATARVSIFLGDGDGQLRMLRTFAVGEGPLSIATTDFNLDGKPDLVVGNFGNRSYRNSTVSLLLGNGNGTFLTAPLFVTLAQVRGVALEDMDGDGQLDLLASHGRDSLSWLQGTGTGAFRSPVDIRRRSFYPTALSRETWTRTASGIWSSPIMPGAN